MVSTHCHFLQKVAWGRARASSYCTYSFFIVARYAIPVARYAIPVARDANRVARDAISVSRKGGNLLLSGTVKAAAKGSRIANHAWSHTHVIDFNNASIIDKGNFRIRKFL